MLTLKILKAAVSGWQRKFACCEERFEPKFGLEPRFEALPQFGKSPKSSCGVRAKALTPLSLHLIFSANLRLVPFSALKAKPKTNLNTCS
ncbi:hypothetical protein [Companilactobacillus heilongjiangensis]|uniref:hypothetical protein n=1 Tax=Companilactobacillus heilongjiangensis TaxID=1074467 RepID=UPI00146FC990|nr:hypothetical protein [Companilactobacillus heilongjiangensis]